MFWPMSLKNIAPFFVSQAKRCELRVEREALQPALATLRLHGDAPLRVAEVEVLAHRSAVLTKNVQQAMHVAHEQAPPRPWLLDHGHRARGERDDAVEA